MVIVLIIISSSVIAAEYELDKDAILTNANIYYYNQFGDAVIDRQLFITDVQVSYAVKPGLFIGGSVYSYMNNTDKDYWYAGPTVIYFFNAAKRENPSNQLFPFIDTYYVYGNESNLKKSMLGMQTGLLIFVSERIGVDFLVSFEKNIYHNDDYGSNNTGYQVFSGIGLSTFIF